MNRKRMRRIRKMLVVWPSVEALWNAFDRLEENSDRAGNFIRESQSILSGIRERGEEGKGET